jgi:predicted nicotinamide N-methyase
MTKKVKAPTIEYTLIGWEDGEPYEKRRSTATDLESDDVEGDGPDRWEIQAADKIIIHFGQPSVIGDIQITQDPHSNQLGGYLWIGSIMLSIYIEHFVSASTSTSTHRLLISVPSGGGSSGRKQQKIGCNTFLELGAGASGLPTIAMNRMGKFAYATDVKQVLKMLKKNMKANLQQEYEHGGHLRAAGVVDTGEMACELEWRDLEQMTDEWEADVSLLVERYAQFEGLDAILLADCIYSEASASALVNTLQLICRVCLRRYNRAPVIFCLSELRDQLAQDRFLSCAKSSGMFSVQLLRREDWQLCLPPSFRLDFYNFYILQFAVVSCDH